jgi:hypothetical protein
MPYPRAVMSLTLLPNAIATYYPKGLHIGYIIPSNKKKLSLSKKQCFKSNENYWYNSLYPYADLHKQGDFKVVINKAVDLLAMKVKFS